MDLSTAHIYSKVLEVSEKSYYRWKSKDHTLLVNLLEQYFTKDELVEYLNNGKIEKLELVKTLDINSLNFKLSTSSTYDRDQRIQEIIQLFKLISHKDISSTLLSCILKHYEKNGVGPDTTIIGRLEKSTSYFVFLHELLDILEDVNSEINLQYREINKDLFQDFNSKIGFDFSIYDIKIIQYILNRYQVYNKLYEIDKK